MADKTLSSAIGMWAILQIIISLSLYMITEKGVNI
jgi:hypothetical protein